MRYLGGDIVEPLIANNQARFGDEHTSFQILDICHDPLPQADLWMCRDCLFHFSYQDVQRAMQNFLRADIPYLLTSTHTACDENIDIVTGDFRLFNLEKPPFSFGRAQVYIKDWIDGYPERYLALWSKESLLQTAYFQKLIEKSRV